MNHYLARIAVKRTNTKEQGNGNNSLKLHTILGLEVCIIKVMGIFVRENLSGYNLIKLVL
jgi:hypothetical protein